MFRESLIVDDPNENPSPSSDWYADQLRKADVVLVHLLSSEHKEAELHNIKASLIAGLASALRRPLLMLAHSPFDSPVDYGHLLQTHDTSESCKAVLSNWLSEVGSGLRRQRQRRVIDRPKSNWTIDDVAIGEPVAEQESDTLEDYFVKTSPFVRALERPTSIILGRRGTGKTAILYAIRSQLEQDKRNHVTLLNPVGYELEGLIQILQDLRGTSERGFLIESLWKYLIYSEIASSLEQSLLAQPVYRERTREESEFLTYCESNAEVINASFASRLDNVVKSLSDIGEESDRGKQRIRISEQLHNTLLRDLRKFIGSILAAYNRMAILIDNLDRPWLPGVHVPQLTELIRGLLDVVQDIPRDFARSGRGLAAVDTRVTVLLRSDIFAFVQPLMGEQDKLPIERVLWNDKELLLRVLNQRLMQNAPSEMEEDDVWRQLFPETVVGISPKEFILQTTLPRPRDVIFMVKSAVDSAINREHQRLHESDLLDAREQYSEFVFRSVIAEDDPQRQKLEAILYEFAGTGRTIDLVEVVERMTKAGVVGSEIEWYVDLLCDIGFLGIATIQGFRYSREESERIRLREIAKRLAARADEDENFEINPAFHQVLQIE